MKQSKKALTRHGRTLAEWEQIRANLADLSDSLPELLLELEYEACSQGWLHHELRFNPDNGNHWIAAETNAGIRHSDDDNGPAANLTLAFEHYCGGQELNPHSGYELDYDDPEGAFLLSSNAESWIDATATAAAKILTDKYGVDDEEVPTDAIGALITRGWSRVSVSNRPYETAWANDRAFEVYEERVAPVVGKVDEIIAELSEAE